MNAGLEQHVKDFRLLVFLAYDAGRITGSRGRELLGFDYLLDFNDTYQTWREGRKERDRIARNQKVTALSNLYDASEAMMAATDDGEQFTQPEPHLLDNLAEAIQAVRVPAQATQPTVSTGTEGQV